MEEDVWRAWNHPDCEVRLAWGWHWSEIVFAFRNDHALWPWMAGARDLDPSAAVLPIVLPIRGGA